jgi:hypothetical protein
MKDKDFTYSRLTANNHAARAALDGETAARGSVAASLEVLNWRDPRTRY